MILSDLERLDATGQFFRRFSVITLIMPFDPAEETNSTELNMSDDVVMMNQPRHIPRRQNPSVSNFFGPQPAINQSIINFNVPISINRPKIQNQGHGSVTLRSSTSDSAKQISL